MLINNNAWRLKKYKKRGSRIFATSFFAYSTKYHRPTGHDGSLSTGHGNSPRDMLARLETMVLLGVSLPVSAIRRQIASGIDIMVHLGRLRDKSRKVLEIIEIVGYRYETEEILTKVLYKFEEDGTNRDQVIGKLVKKSTLTDTRKLVQRGISIE